MNQKSGIWSTSGWAPGSPWGLISSGQRSASIVPQRLWEWVSSGFPHSRLSMEEQWACASLFITSDTLSQLWTNKTCSHVYKIRNFLMKTIRTRMKNVFTMLVLKQTKHLSFYKSVDFYKKLFGFRVKHSRCVFVFSCFRRWVFILFLILFFF